MIDIALINRASKIRDATFLRLVPALQAQVTDDFCPAWSIEAVTLHFVGKAEQPDPAHWKVWWLDTSDEAGDLGYHENDPGIPEAKIFTLDDMRYGAEISVTTSHEILEMLGDPYINRLSDPIEGLRYALEASDCVEADGDGYLKLGYRMSDFALPDRWIPGSSGPWDFCRLLTGPAPLRRPGGYDLVLDGQGKWQTNAERYADGTMSHRAWKPEGRSARRAAKAP